MKDEVEIPEQLSRPDAMMMLASAIRILRDDLGFKLENLIFVFQSLWEHVPKRDDKTN